MSQGEAIMRFLKIPILPKDFAELIILESEEKISHHLGKIILKEMFKTGNIIRSKIFEEICRREKRQSK